jgi:hypothetical protein
MVIGSTALFNLIIILIICAVAGLAFNRYARSWLARLGSTTRSDATAALVGIAGAFIRFPSGPQHRPGQTSYPSSNRRHHSLFGSSQAAVLTFRARPRLVTGLLSFLCVCA